MLDLCRRFLRKDNGATAIEYGLICALVVVIMIAALTQVAGSTTNMYTMLINTWSAAVAST